MYLFLLIAWLWDAFFCFFSCLAYLMDTCYCKCYVTWYRLFFCIPVFLGLVLGRIKVSWTHFDHVWLAIISFGGSWTAFRCSLNCPHSSDTVLWMHQLMPYESGGHSVLLIEISNITRLCELWLFFLSFLNYNSLSGLSIFFLWRTRPEAKVPARLLCVFPVPAHLLLAHDPPFLVFFPQVLAPFMSRSFQLSAEIRGLAGQV